MIHYADDWLTVHQGDCREVMAGMEPESVHCVVTSPPYWGLRDYGTASWDGGDPACDHKAGSGGHLRDSVASTRGGAKKVAEAQAIPFKNVCGKCGATRQDAQLGLEPTPELYVAAMVEVFRAVRRVLRNDGTVWLNLGDSYAASGGDDRKGSSDGATGRGDRPDERRRAGLKPKDLVGIPWRVAFALQQPYYTGRIKSELDRVWLAGLMDGEGTFTILSTTSPHGSGNSYPPIAQIRMTSQAVVQKAASLVGVASPAQYPPSNRGNRAVYQWRLNGRRAADTAAEVYPYLIEKRKQAIVVWNHQAIRDSYETKRGVPIPTAAVEKQLLCRDIIRRLNRAEHVDLPGWMVEPSSLMEPGWYLRSDVIWAKPNPMPESVTDRPTKAHEYLFLLSKSARYFYDADAVAEGVVREWDDRNGTIGRNRLSVAAGGQNQPTTGAGVTARNLRSVWTIATQPYPGAHFATFPEALVEPCVKAGSPEGGVVLDPFGGSGTTARVANRLSRRAVLIDLSTDYLDQAIVRNAQSPMGLVG